MGGAGGGGELFRLCPDSSFLAPTKKKKEKDLPLPPRQGNRGEGRREETMRREEGDKVTTTTSKGKWEGGEGRRGPRPRRHSQTPLFCTHSVTKAISPCPPPHLFLSQTSVRNIVVVRVKNGSLRLAKWPSEGRRKNHQSVTRALSKREKSEQQFRVVGATTPSPPQKKDGA